MLIILSVEVRLDVARSVDNVICTCSLKVVCHLHFCPLSRACQGSRDARPFVIKIALPSYSSDRYRSLSYTLTWQHPIQV